LITGVPTVSEDHNLLAALESPSLDLNRAFDQVVNCVIATTLLNDALFRLAVDVFHTADHENDHLVKRLR